ncbi:hypothetical protein BJ944DRAFT_133341 [Cunninghamella echinulata]|nr:hypothetical protein BJ944DRAFT_133341 [Cunninghamella echinulata]
MDQTKKVIYLDRRTHQGTPPNWLPQAWSTSGIYPIPPQMITLITNIPFDRNATTSTTTTATNNNSNNLATNLMGMTSAPGMMLPTTMFPNNFYNPNMFFGGANNMMMGPPPPHPSPMMPPMMPNLLQQQLQQQQLFQIQQQHQQRLQSMNNNNNSNNNNNNNKNNSNQSSANNSPMLTPTSPNLNSSYTQRKPISALIPMLNNTHISVSPSSSSTSNNKNNSNNNSNNNKVKRQSSASSSNKHQENISNPNTVQQQKQKPKKKNRHIKWASKDQVFEFEVLEEWKGREDHANGDEKVYYGNNDPSMYYGEEDGYYDQVYDQGIRSNNYGSRSDLEEGDYYDDDDIYGDENSSYLNYDEDMYEQRHYYDHYYPEDDAYEYEVVDEHQHYNNNGNIPSRGGSTGVIGNRRRNWARSRAFQHHNRHLIKEMNWYMVMITVYIILMM